MSAYHLNIVESDVPEGQTLAEWRRTRLRPRPRRRLRLRTFIPMPRPVTAG